MTKKKLIRRILQECVGDGDFALSETNIPLKHSKVFKELKFDFPEVSYEIFTANYHRFEGQRLSTLKAILQRYWRDIDACFRVDINLNQIEQDRLSVYQDARDQWEQARHAKRTGQTSLF